MLQSDVANINFLSAMMINLKLNDILFNEGKRGNERITMTLLHIRIKKKTNDIFIMQIVAYFFIFIERFTQSYEHI